MITLTKPVQVSSTLGTDNALVPYDRIVLNSINIEVSAQLITANVRLTASTNAEMPEINGSLIISVPQAKLTIEIGSIARRRIALTAGQNNAARKIIDDTQNALEAGMISLDVIKGTQAPGA